MSDDFFVEKRQSVRVVISVPAKVRLIDQAEKERLVSAKKAFYDNAANPPALPQDPCIANFFIQIDEKLDRILELLENRDEDENQVTVQKTVNLSGNGLGMILKDPLPQGQLIHVTLRLPDFPLGKFTACGEVVRINPYDENGETLYEAGVRFFDLTRTEQDSIISYTFCKQRENIRHLKTDPPENPDTTDPDSSGGQNH